MQCQLDRVSAVILASNRAALIDHPPLPSQRTPSTKYRARPANIDSFASGAGALFGQTYENCCAAILNLLGSITETSISIHAHRHAPAQPYRKRAVSIHQLFPFLLFILLHTHIPFLHNGFGTSAQLAALPRDIFFSFAKRQHGGGG